MKKNRGGGLFIVFEGIDGAGTTTQAEILKQRLESAGRAALVTCEPTKDGPIGKLIRRGLDPKDEECRFDGLEMAMLFAADRRHHIRTLIRPQVEAGVIVISDRYQMSSHAYQVNETTNDWVDVLARDVPKPDLTILVDVPVEVAAERRRQRGGMVERYDDAGVQTRVRDNYLSLAREDTSVVVVDGNRKSEEVAGEIWTIVWNRLSAQERRIEPVQLTDQDLREMGDEMDDGTD
jgi:dTMP kinase